MFRPIRLIANRYPRKCRLFAAACCYRIWHLLSDERSRRSVELAVQVAEGFVDEEQLSMAAEEAQAAHAEAFRAEGKIEASAEWAAQFAASPDAWFAMTRASNFAYIAAGDEHQGGPEHSAQSHLLRCIFGPIPFRPVTIDQSCLLWNDGAVVEMAKAIYNGQAFERLPFLADFLETAGCRDTDILTHCRHSQPHVRGCWVIDMILEKS